MTIIFDEHEATVVASALQFVCRNLTMFSEGYAYRFVAGERFEISLEKKLSILYFIDELLAAIKENSEKIHFAGCCRVF